MAILLALLSALAYGTADYVAGVVSQKSSAWQVAVIATLTATAAAIPVALLEGGDPAGRDWGLAVVAGLGSGFGSAFLYRGLATARMSVVAPLSAVTTAVIPVGIGLGLGERPSTLALLGIAIAIPAIVLVASAAEEAGDAGETASAAAANKRQREAVAGAARTAGEHGARVHDYAHVHDPALGAAPRSSGIVDGLLAGAGFGVLFAAAGRIDEAAGMAPTVLMQVAGLVAVVGVATALREDWVPRTRAAWSSWPVGPLVVVAVVALMLATREGLLSVVAVIASLYPAVTVLLAAALLGERVSRGQAIGLALAAGAVSLVAAG